MESNDQKIIVKPKKWFKISNYIASVVGLILFAYIINQTLFNESGDPAFVIYLLAGVSILGSIACVFTILTQHRHQILISDESIQKIGYTSKEVPFGEINKVVLRKGGIEIHAEGIFETISFGDLHHNYKKALQFLSNKLSAEDDIDIKGNEKFVNHFLSANS